MGRALVERLLARGDRVTLANRGVSPDPFGRAVRRLAADRFRPGELPRALRGRGDFDAAVDFLGVDRAPSLEAAEILSGRAGHFVHLSSTAVYEIVADPGRPLQEEDYDGPPGPPLRDPRAAAYARRKRAAEEALREVAGRTGLPVTILRPGFVEGPCDPTGRTWRYLAWLRSGRTIPLPDGGRQRISRVFRDDVVDALVAALAHGPPPRPRAYDVAQDETPSLAGYLQRMARVLGVTPRFRDVPAEVLRADEELRAWHPFWIDQERDLVVSGRRARRELGLQPTPLEAWLAHTCAWIESDANPLPPPGEPPQRSFP